LRPDNKVQFLGESHHSKEGFLMGPITKKGENKKTRKTE